MSFLFKPVKYMDAIRVFQSLFYESMIPILCPKPSSFYANKPSLYSLKLILFGGSVFINNHGTVILSCIICRRNMTIDNKVKDLILIFLQLGLTYIFLCFQYNVFIFTILQIIIEECNCCILYFNGFMPDVLLHLGLDTACKIFNFHCMKLITKLLPNMMKQHFAAASSEVFCFWPKIRAHNTFLISANIVLLRILWSIDWCTCSMYTAHLILLADIFWAAVGPYDVFRY